MNPLGFNYGMDTTAVPGFAKPTAIIVTGRGNRYDEDFQIARGNGALVYQYYMTFELPDNLNNPQDEEQYLMDGELPPLWPYKDANGNDRTQWEGTKLIDIRPESPYIEKVKQFTRDMIARGHVDGFMLDGMGWRLYGNADWENWPQEERDEWTRAQINLARIIHEIRVELQPSFELVHNNNWDSSGDCEWSEEGEQYCNGIVAENSSYGDFWIAQAAKTFAGEPYPKRFLVICPNEEKAEQWKCDPNVTHITLVNKSEDQNYQQITPAIVDYEDENPPVDTCEEQLAAAAEQIEQLETANANLSGRMTQIAEHAAEISRLACA